MKDLKQHVIGDKVKWIVTLLVGLALIGAVIGLAIKLERQTSTTIIGGEAYSIGTLDEAGEYKAGDTAIYLRKAVNAEGIKCELAKDSKITYQLFFYDKDGKFLSASETLTANFDGTVPEKAESVKIMITPTADEDGKVSFTEVLGYVDQLTVTVKK